ncbi:hypothetical protein [Leptospira idonii]|uniref:Uncharacterized protein n=1 Tax=Leptospira idonii TaxID=1193500 RepID=A0A4R9LZ54_9LEPT|nr:hypothetical protein [Leptospira idonii]TGN19022.1 hypothetical protein EHS15_11475 [Leptospira idonii]
MILAQLANPYSIEQIKVLEDRVSSYETWVFVLVFFSAVLALISIMQRLTIAKLKRTHSSPENTDSKTNSLPEITSLPDVHTITQTVPLGTDFPKIQDLLEPGLVYKFVLPGKSFEKIITIGKNEGTIRTFSSDLVDYHLTIVIRKTGEFEADSEEIAESYHIELRREGKVLISLPGESGLREMNAKEKIYVQNFPAEDEIVSYSGIESKDPIRFRLGERWNSENRFIKGYFEFHFFSKDVNGVSPSGSHSLEKQFFLRVYKVYPGYDTAKQQQDGSFPMKDSFVKSV